MARFTFAPTCVCINRGYVIAANGWPVACDLCELGATWAAAHAAPVAEIATAELAPVQAIETPDLAPTLATEAPDLAPALAPQPIKLKARRTSTRIPGLAYETQVSDRGVFVTFRHGGAYSVYALTGGAAELVECSDRFFMPREVERHILEFARQLAGLVARAVA